jgi:3-deoxy-D-manno-octulosonate 8-phosphate phosphatase (KDO 8-P phosphatase)
MNNLDLHERAARIKLLLMDCDGVLTDGRIWILESGEDQKAFHTRDGLGIELLHRAGLQSGIISGRVSGAVERRARDLGMSFIWQGHEDKLQAFAETLAQAEVANEQVAVADAAVETREHAHYVTTARGGRGAIREVVELILRAQGRWNDVVRKYLIADLTE